MDKLFGWWTKKTRNYICHLKNDLKLYIFDEYLKRNKIFEFDSRLQSQNKRYDNFVSDNVLSVCFSKLQEQELQVV